MFIHDIKIYRVRMPLLRPFKTAFGEEHEIETILVRMQSDNLFGWGESSPWEHPRYSPEWAGGVFEVIRKFLAPSLTGKDIQSGQDLQDRLKWVKGNNFAKAGLDLAWWDLFAKQKKTPLWEVLGGESPIVEVGADIGILENIDLLLEEIYSYIQQGYKRVKLKYSPDWGLDVMKTVRSEFPDFRFHVDCNSAFTLSDLPMFRELDKLGFVMIEQPLAHDDLIDHAELQKDLNTPVCLDESITSYPKARKAIAVGACKWVNIKPGRVGGLTEAVKIHNTCEEEDIPCWIGGMLESAIGASHCLALGTLPNIKYPSDVFPSNRFYEEDLGNLPIDLSGVSTVEASSKPGIGVEPNPDKLDHMQSEYAHLSSD